jgi:transposase
MTKQPSVQQSVPAVLARGRGGYPPEFRRDSVAAWRNSGISAAQYARQIGIDPSTLYTWIRHSESPLPGVAGGGAPATPRTIEQLEAALRAAQAELERTRQQRDILKKTLGIVCEPSPSAMPGSPR